LYIIYIYKYKKKKKKRIPPKAPETAWEIYYNYHPVIFIFFNFLYLRMKYGPNRFNRNPRGSAAATVTRTGERLNYYAAGFCAPRVLHSAILFIFISLSVKRTTLGIVAVVFANVSPAIRTPVPHHSGRFTRKGESVHAPYIVPNNIKTWISGYLVTRKGFVCFMTLRPRKKMYATQNIYQFTSSKQSNMMIIVYNKCDRKSCCSFI